MFLACNRVDLLSIEKKFVFRSTAKSANSALHLSLTLAGVSNDRALLLKKHNKTKRIVLL